MSLSAPHQRQLEACTQLVKLADALVDEAQRVESCFTFAPREDRDLRAIAAAIKKAHDELQLELVTYVLQYRQPRT